MASIRRALVTLGLVVLLALYGELLTHAPAVGQDFRNFYAAATLLRHGGNPYDARQFLATELQLNHPATVAARASLAGNPYVQGPLLAITLLPFTGVPPATVYRWYVGVLVIALVLALILLSRLWPAPRSPGRIVVLAISPVSVVGLLLGQADAVLLLAFALALWCSARERYGLAGCVLALGLIKPQLIAGPLFIFAVLAWRRGLLLRYVAGCGLGSVIFLGISLLVAGSGVVAGWLHELQGFGGATVYAQVDIASLTTLYVGWAPHAVATMLSAVTVLAWVALCVVLIYSPHPPVPLLLRAGEGGRRDFLRGLHPRTPALFRRSSSGMASRPQRCAATPLRTGLPAELASRRCASDWPPSEAGGPAWPGALRFALVRLVHRPSRRCASDGTPGEAGSPAWPARSSERSRLIRASGMSETQISWQSADDEHRWIAVAIVLWLLATPYAHPHDDVLLLPSVWYLLDRRPYRGWALALGVLAFAAWWLLPMTSLLGLRPPLIRGLGIIPVLALALLMRAISHQQPAINSSGAAESVTDTRVPVNKITA